VVSAGAEKNFREFTIRLAKRQRRDPDQQYFQRLVAKAILFRRSERLVSQGRFGGYRANIVAYTVAYVSHRTGQRIDLDRIWRDQDLSEELTSAVREVARAVHALITDPPGGANVTEWCKREACWSGVRSLDIPLNDLGDAVLPSDRSEERDRGLEGADSRDVEAVDQVSELPADAWFSLARWAKQTDNLAPWQRGVAFSIGRLLAQKQRPSRRQAQQGLILLGEARRVGFIVPESVDERPSQAG
jgi:hypothetical protein